ncbi:UNVERIFIED_CONTAM: hypothetical protein NCL1_59344 [Trichonephila clavipes]
MHFLPRVRRAGTGAALSQLRRRAGQAADSPRREARTLPRFHPARSQGLKRRRGDLWSPLRYA